MAKVQAVWGIDIGQCSLKALRCVSGENGEVIADAFDFVEYPKILSQPDVEPEELIAEALQQFLSRNDLLWDWRWCVIRKFSEFSLTFSVP